MSAVWVVCEDERNPSRWHSDYVRNGWPVRVLSRHRSFDAASKAAARVRRGGRSPVAVEKLDGESAS